MDRFAPLVSRVAATRRGRRHAVAALSLIALAAAALHPRTAHAMTPLDETQLAQVRGQDGSFQLQRRATASTTAMPPLLKSLLGLFPAADLHVSLLDRRGFETALAGQGIKPFEAPFYNGGPVSQVQIEGAPVNASFELGQLIAGSFGLNYQGPSMGTVNINGLNASGTTLWVWSH